MALISSDWEKRSFFGGGRQSHDGAVQSCGGGVGEDLSVQTLEDGSVFWHFKLAKYKQEERFKFSGTVCD